MSFIGNVSLADQAFAETVTTMRTALASRAPS